MYSCRKAIIVPLFLLIVAVFGIACNRPVAIEPGLKTREVVLLYTNDFESAYDPIQAFWRDDLKHVGGVAELASLIQSERAKAELSFLLDAGDIFTGTLAKLTHGELPFELMITMGYDAMCIGNHEFEYGWWVLRDAMHRAPFPVLAANLFYEGTDIPFVQPSTIIERDGFRLGVVGVFGTDAATALFPPHLAGIEVRDPGLYREHAVVGQHSLLEGDDPAGRVFRVIQIDVINQNILGEVAAHRTGNVILAVESVIDIEAAAVSR